MRHFLSEANVRNEKHSLVVTGVLEKAISSADYLVNEEANIEAFLDLYKSNFAKIAEEESIRHIINAIPRSFNVYCSGLNRTFETFVLFVKDICESSEQQQQQDINVFFRDSINEIPWGDSSNRRRKGTGQLPHTHVKSSTRNAEDIPRGEFTDQANHVQIKLANLNYDKTIQCKPDTPDFLPTSLWLDNKKPDGLYKLIETLLSPQTKSEHKVTFIFGHGEHIRSCLKQCTLIDFTSASESEQDVKSPLKFEIIFDGIPKWYSSHIISKMRSSETPTP